MKKIVKSLCVGFGLAGLLAAGAHAAPFGASDVKETYQPNVNGAPITLMRDNIITQSLGGRMLDLDVWFGEAIKFDDNIYNTKNDKKDDTIFSTAAGFLLQAEERETWKLRMEGQFQYNVYADNSDYNGAEGYFHSAGSIDFSPAVTGRLFFNYDNYYDNIRNVQDIYGMHQFSTGAGVTLRPSPYFSVDLDYSYFGQRRDVNILDYQDYNEHTFSLRPSYALTPNTTVYVQMSGGQVKPLEDTFYSTTTSYSAVAGLIWRYMDIFQVNAEAGYKHMHFDANRTSSGGNHDCFAARLSADYAFTEDWTAGINLSYAPYYGAVISNAANSNYVERFISGAYLKYSPGAGRFVFNLAPYYSNNSPSKDTDYAEYGVNVGVAYAVTEWFNLTAGYRYSVTDYKDSSSWDRNTVTVGCFLTF